MIELFTIGFTQKKAEQFFGLLKQHGVTMLVDTRLKPDVQLSGFAKRNDLHFFMREIVGGSYIHLPNLSPTPEILDTYRADKDWRQYEVRFNALLDQRDIPEVLDRAMFERERCCLLCSEHLADKCHRRLVAERMAAEWAPVTITHLH